jgi:hypothetical protein
MSALVWSVESALLGVWALLLSFYSTPFHAFIARSHSMIAGFTLILQLIAAARGLAISHAISEAFVCAVSALLLIYVASLLDTANHKRLFSMPSAGILPLDAVIGAAWFCAAMISATGMALSGVDKGSNQRAQLMFHQYGYHMSVVLPSLLMLWLYNYDARDTKEPVRQGINMIRNNDVTITHTLIFIVYACIWGWFVVAHFIGEGIFTCGGRWQPWSDMSCGSSAAYVTAVVLKFMGRGGCVLIPLSATFSAATTAQTMLAWVLVGLAAAYAIDLLGIIERLAGFSSDQATAAPPSYDAPINATAPTMQSEFAFAEPVTTAPHSDFMRNDPAALVLHANSHQWRRDKMV